jgi:molybdopterin molybdotransferase
MNADFPTRISFEEAGAILDRVAAEARLPVEDCALQRALGRVLAEDLVAGIDLPPFDNSAMDGFAVRAADLEEGATLRLVGEQFAGTALQRLDDSAGAELAGGECIRITTGAPMPPGADTVVMKENCALEGNRVRILSAPAAGANLRRAAEDVRRGERVLEAGRVLTPAAIGLAAALGEATLRVHRRPTVAVFTTGDELRPPGSHLGPGEIFDSNRALLQTLLVAEGFEPVAWPVLPDDPARIEAALRDVADSFDVVISCGAVSAGEKDFLPALLAAEGSIHFWKVRMRPGMPVLAARLGNAQFLGLPGNPVSVLATFLTLGRRLLDGLQGRREPRPRRYARLAAPIRKRHERLEFLRGELYCDDGGQWLATPNPADGSHRLRAAAEANALIVVPEGAGEWPAGSVLEVLPLAFG